MNTQTFDEMTAAAYDSAQQKAAPWVPSRSQIEAELLPVVQYVETLDDPQSFIRETLRPGSWGMTALAMWKERNV